MTKLPERNLLEGTKNPETTTGEFRLAMGNLRQFLFDLFGDESSDKETARKTLGIDLDGMNGTIAMKADRESVEKALLTKADIDELAGVAFTGSYNDLTDKLEKSDTLQGYGILVDNVPTEGSTRPVTSEGIKNYIDLKTTAIPHGMKMITESGPFVVPPGVSSVFVRLCGGGGSGRKAAGQDAVYGTSGGTSSFGTYMTATGGHGGCAWGNAGGGGWGGPGGTGTGDIVFNGVTGTPSGTPSPFPYIGQRYGCGGAVGYGGGSGGFVMGWVTNLTPGTVIEVTIGVAGGSEAGSGMCMVNW